MRKIFLWIKRNIVVMPDPDPQPSWLDDLDHVAHSTTAEELLYR